MTNPKERLSQMTYKHLSTDELTIIYSFWTQSRKAYLVAQALRRSAETIYRVYRFFDGGKNVVDYLTNYKKNKKCCGRHLTQLSKPEIEYINEKVSLGWQPDTIIGRGEINFSCSSRTLYRLFKRSLFGLSAKKLPMKGNRKPNYYIEKRGKAGHLGRSLTERKHDYPNYDQEFGHLEGDTVQGKHHKGAVTTLVERKTKVAIVLNSHNKSADSVTQSITNWLKNIPKHLFKSITFDNGKEFADWRIVANQHDLNIYFADVGAPNQRGLNENNNGLLRKDGLSRQLTFDNLSDDFVQSVASRRNNIPRKSLNYKTPLEAFIKEVTNDRLLISNLI